MKKVLFVLSMLFLCTGCAKKTESSQIQVLEEAESSIQSKFDEEEIETPISFQDEACKNKLKQAIVRIECPKQSGSGVILEKNSQFLCILTARHVVENQEKFDILLSTGEYVTSSTVNLSKEYDLAVIRIPMHDLADYQIDSLSQVELSERSMEDMLIGEKVLLFGSGKYVASDYVEGYIQLFDEKVDIPSLYTAQNMMAGIGDVYSGMSGCGIFDSYGKLIGILAGGGLDALQVEGETAFVGIPIWHIRDWKEKNYDKN